MLEVENTADNLPQRQVASGRVALAVTHQGSHRPGRADATSHTRNDRSRYTLTVLGTSAESGDSGQVGRGNRVKGLISLNRPLTLEAAAGKNPVSHVGKAYNVLAHQIAERIHHECEAVDEAYVWLCSQIGSQLDQPWFASVQLALSDGAIGDVLDQVTETVNQQLADVYAFTERLIRGELPVC